MFGIFHLHQEATFVFVFDISILKVIFDVCLGSKKLGDSLTLQINNSKVYFSAIDTDETKWPTGVNLFGKDTFYLF